MNEHRVPMLGAALRRRKDPTRSSDPRVRELVAALSRVELTGPRPEFRSELRAQLVAVAPRLVAEGAEEAEAVRPPARAAAAEPVRRFRFVKPLVVAACVLTSFVLLLGGAVLISRHALPGDALYGVKRASEDTEYSLTSGSVARGKLKLQFAARRIGEVGDLLPKAGALGGVPPAGRGTLAGSGAINAGTARLVRSTLGSADDDVRTAAQLLGTTAVRNQDAGPLSAITSWTPAQLRAMNGIVARIPAGALHQRALATRQLLLQAQQRATQLRADLGCSCLDSTGTDQLGPLPCTGRCGTPSRSPSTGPGNHPGTGSSSPRSAVPGRPGPSASVRSNHPAGGTKPPRAGSTAPVVRSSAPNKPGPSTTAGGGLASPSAPGVLPTLPGVGGSSSHGSKAPVSASTCGINIVLGPISAGVGNC